MTQENEHYNDPNISPYCPICNSCGVWECCDPIVSVEKHMRYSTPCLYKDEILREFRFNRALLDAIYDDEFLNILDYKTAGKINRLFDEVWDKIKKEI